MSTLSPSTFLIDITPLFMYGCSKRNLDLSATYIGGLTKLTDLCCHLSVMRLKNKDTHEIQNMIDTVLNGEQLTSSFSELIRRTIYQYAEVIFGNFMRLVVTDDLTGAINHIVVHHAHCDYSAAVTVRQHVTLKVNATLHWHELGRM